MAPLQAPYKPDSNALKDTMCKNKNDGSLVLRLSEVRKTETVTFGSKEPFAGSSIKPLKSENQVVLLSQRSHSRNM